MPIENRDLAVGTVLVGRHKGRDRSCEVVETPDGVRYRLDDGTEHKSPSSAGKAAMGGVACNGWRFWSIKGAERARPQRKSKPEKPSKSEKAKARKKAAKKRSAAMKTAATRADRPGGTPRVDGRLVRMRHLRPNLRRVRAATNHETPHTRI